MKATAAGSEVDAWCTRCRLDLGHRVKAMVGSTIKRVVCLTCGSEHAYRAPPDAVPAQPKAKAPVAPSRGVKAERDRVGEWERRVLGLGPQAFTRYSMNGTFGPDELVVHEKFGEGYVVGVVDRRKVQIMFREGLRTLACAT